MRHVLAVLAAALVVSPAGAGPIIDLGDFEARGMNDTGTVVGRQAGLPVVWEAGTLTVLDAGGYYANDVNNSGVIVGASRGPNAFPVPTVWAAGVPSQLGGTPSGLANAISENGIIAGYDTSATNENGYIWFNGTINPLGSFNTSVGLTNAIDVNDRGQVAGSAYDVRARRFAYVIDPEDTNGDGTPDLWNRDDDNDGVNDLMLAISGEGGLVSGINAAGTVVGRDDAGGFRWSPGGGLERIAATPVGINDAGTLLGNFPGLGLGIDDGSGPVTLDSLLPADSGWVLDTAVAINNRGWVIGRGFLDGVSRSYLLLPEPATLTLLSLGLVMVRRRAG